ENTYTPPSIPSHIPISLEPVVGAPSDEALESAHSAVRTFENLVNTRYIQDSNQGHFSQRLANTQSPPHTNASEPSIVATSIPPNTEDQQGPQKVGSIEVGSSLLATSHTFPPNRIVSEPVSTTIPQTNVDMDQFCVAQHETNRLLGGNEELLRDIRQILRSTHHNVHRAYGPGHHYAYRTINEKGELPWMRYLDDVYASSSDRLSRSITTKELVGYLRFYGIGAELIEEETGNLKPDKEAEAQKLLAIYLYYGRPPVPPTV
ncbi:hypothetical protein FRC11_011359, partial [Ceratobasidium sp. 423]